MTLTVENGEGLAIADALVSVAGADAYHEAIGHTAWAAASTDGKEQAIRRATAYLSSLPWAGLRRRGRDQALGWPRCGLMDREGYGIDADTVPPEIVNACAEIALQELASPGSMTPVVTPADDKVAKREKIGELEIEYAIGSFGPDAHRAVITKVQALIGPFLSRGNPLSGGSMRV